MNVLLLGSCGYKGWYLAMHFANKNNVQKVICVDNFNKQMTQEKNKLFYIDSKLSYEEKISTFNMLTRKYKLIQENGDINNTSFIQRILNTYRPQLVINCTQQGSKAMPCNDLENNHSMWENNTSNIINLTYYMSWIIPGSTLINFSSLTNTTNNFFNLTKQTGSKLLEVFSNQYRIFTIDLSLGEIYGIEYDKQLHDNLITRIPCDNIYGGFINKLIFQLVYDNDIIIKGDTTRQLPLIEINDVLKVVDICLKQLQQMKDKDRVSVYYKNINTFAEIQPISEIIKIIMSSYYESGQSCDVKYIKSTELNNYPKDIKENNDELLSIKLIGRNGGYFKPFLLKDSINKLIGDMSNVQQIKT